MNSKVDTQNSTAKINSSLLSFIHFENADIFGLSHLGLVKKVNEDQYLIKQLEDKSLLLAVADGLGDDVSGGFAAEIVKTRLSEIKHLTPGREKKELDQIAKELDHFIFSKARQDPKLEGMATTLVCVVLKNDDLYWINVGDSRLYLFRENQLTQITEDQTLARFLVAEGEITPAQAKEHYSRVILDQCIGYGECEPETGMFKIEKGDLLVLSTDGFYKMVSEPLFLSILNESTKTKGKTKKLVEAALDSGGRDNITIVMAKVDQTAE